MQDMFDSYMFRTGFRQILKDKLLKGDVHRSSEIQCNVAYKMKHTSQYPLSSDELLCFVITNPTNRIWIPYVENSASSRLHISV